LNWNATTLTSVNIDLERSIKETIGVFFSGYVSTNTLVTVDHELRRNLLLKLGFNYITDDYESLGTAERDDTTYDALVGSTYLINRYINVSMQYHNIRRDSSSNVTASSNSVEFEKDIIYIQLRAQF
jgi:hypothetical protein